MRNNQNKLIFKYLISLSICLIFIFVSLVGKLTKHSNKFCENNYDKNYNNTSSNYNNTSCELTGISYWIHISLLIIILIIFAFLIIFTIKYKRSRNKIKVIDIIKI